MGKKSQDTKTRGKTKEIKTLKSLEKPIKRKKSTLKKSASQLEILCNAKVCCVMEGPTGVVEVWPENHADAVSIITKYKQSSKKAKLSRSKTNLVQFEEENKGSAMVEDSIDQFLNNMESFEGIDIDQYLNNTMLFADQNKGFDIGDDFDQLLMSKNVERNKGFDMGGEKSSIFEIDELLNYEENKDFDQNKGFSLGKELDSLSGESWKHISDNLGAKIVDQGITSSVEGDDYDQQNQQKFVYHVPDIGSSNSLKVEGGNVLIDHEFDQILNDFFAGNGDLKKGFPDCSRSNAHMSAAQGYEQHQVDSVCGMWPSDTLWPSSQYSGLEGANCWPNYSTNFENENNNFGPFLSSPGEQPKLMGSNKSIGDIGRN